MIKEDGCWSTLTLVGKIAKMFHPLSSKTESWPEQPQEPLNIKKTKAMIIGINRKLSNTSSITVHVNGNTTENVEHFSYLGVTLSAAMTWNEHITILSSKVNEHLGLLRKIRHLLPHSARLLFYNCLVLPLFDYGDLV